MDVEIIQETSFQKKKINDEEYIWAYKQKNEWIISKKSYARAKVLLTKEWCFNNIPLFAKNNNVPKADPVPPILDLGNKIIDVEVRGERMPNKCYFKVKDVCNIINNKKLSKTIHKKKYKKGLHYTDFIVNDQKRNI